MSSIAATPIRTFGLLACAGLALGFATASAATPPLVEGDDRAPVASPRGAHWVTGRFEDRAGTMYTDASRRTIDALQGIAKYFCGAVRFGPVDRLVPIAAGRTFSLYIPKLADVRLAYRQTGHAVGDAYLAVEVGYGEWPIVGNAPDAYRKDWARATCPGVTTPLPH